MSNTQPISKREYREDGHLLVHSVFPTMQGEGPFAGHPAIFVRLAGCNLQCPACDTDYTIRPLIGFQNYWNSKILRNLVVGRIAGIWKQHQGNHLVVITGGEPFRQNLVPFVQDLLSAEFDVQIETNGTLWNKDMAVLCGLFGQHLTIVCSPKTGRLDPGILEHAKHFKYILQAGQVDPNDGLPLSTMMHEGAVARPPAGAIVYVQPLDEEFMFIGKALGNTQVSAIRQAWDLEQAQAANIKTAAESAMKFGYRLSIQTHKIANLE